MRKLPPLNAVRTFEVAARVVSFTKAAEELHVTHGAVSRQVALLEEWFGVKLFRRGSSQLTLTDAGTLYYREVTAILDRLALATMDVKERSAPAALRVNAPPTFTMRWLMGRMSKFQRQRSDVELQLTTSFGPLNANDLSFDVAIRGEQERMTGWKAVPFMTELIVPVCRADLIPAERLTSPDSLRDYRLVTYLTEPYGWREWFTRAGGEMASAQEIVRFEQMYFALQAVQEGMGIGLFPIFLVIDELESGRLRLPFGALGVRRRAYSAHFRTDSEGWPALRDFCDWLVEAGRDTDETTRSWAAAMDLSF